ncbi:MAG: chemotaxis protein CheV [Bacteriovoracia bacterium]
MSAVTTRQKESAEHLLVLSFLVETPVGSIHCGMNVHKIREVIEASHLSPLPNGYTPFVGIHELRGVPIPIMRLDYVFNREMKTPFQSEQGRIIVTELQGKTVGLLVSSTGRIRSFHNSEVLAPPSALEGIKTRFFNGVLNDDLGYTYLLDLESILESFGLSLDRDVSVAGEKPIFEGKQILVVEDSKLYQKKLKSIFTAWGCQLLFANNGKEALEILKQKAYDFDLIFCDIEMPIMNGIEFATKVKKIPEANRIPLVFNSSLSNPALISEIKEKSLGGYIIKFDQDTIREEIGKVLVNGPTK